MNITYVSFVAGKIFIDNVQQELIKSLKDLGGQEEEPDNANIIIKYSDENEKVRLFKELRDLGIAFSAGRDWSPSEQFEELRERGLITGKYKHIGWSGPDNYKVDER
jgi:hypothetical protein